jgi:hypothetical protein
MDARNRALPSEGPAGEAGERRGEREGESTGEMGELKKPGDPMGDPGERTMLHTHTERGREEVSACIFGGCVPQLARYPSLYSRQVLGQAYIT